MAPTEILDRRIAELETRLDELRALRKLLEPATLAVLPLPARTSEPLPEVELEPEPVKVPAPNEERRVAFTPLAANGQVKKVPAKEEPKPAKKPGRPSGERTESPFLSQLLRERAVAVARVLTEGPLARKDIVERTGLNDSVLTEIFQRQGCPPKPAVAAWFQKEGGHFGAWRLTELGRKELLPATPTEQQTQTASA